MDGGSGGPLDRLPGRRSRVRTTRPWGVSVSPSLVRNSLAGGRWADVDCLPTPLVGIWADKGISSLPCFRIRLF